LLPLSKLLAQNIATAITDFVIIIGFRMLLMRNKTYTIKAKMYFRLILAMVVLLAL
jgi:hypothetical protein